MDVNMPVCDGMACTREIRRLEDERDDGVFLRVIGCTGNARQEQVGLRSKCFILEQGECRLIDCFC